MEVNIRVIYFYLYNELCLMNIYKDEYINIKEMLIYNE